MSEPWTSERTEKLRELWADGLSASQCAEKLGGGITRNAVISKVHRSGFAERTKGETGRGVKSTKTKAAPAPAKEPVPIAAPSPAPRLAPIEQAFAQAAPPPPPAGAGVTLIELRLSSCRWVNGDPRDDSHRYCGERRETMEDGKSYCSFHAALAYRRDTFNPSKRKASDKHTAWLARSC
jgi:GcrA cell cycle regulator